MQPRITVITLGVKDIAKSQAFYEALGFKASSTSNADFVAFQAGGVLLCLFGEKALAEDAQVDDQRSGFRGVAIAHNVEKKDEVKQVLDHVSKIGGKVLKQAQDVFWGGHSGYFADPDGHLWEVAWNPHWTMKDGMVRLPN